MAKHILQIVSDAYRVTVEEQDDPTLWITQAMAGAGGKFTVLLKGNAVNYAVRTQDATGLTIGGWRQTQPPRPQDDLSRIMEKGMEVFVVAEDVADRGLERTDLVSGLKSLGRAEMPTFIAKFDQVWAW